MSETEQKLSLQGTAGHKVGCLLALFRAILRYRGWILIWDVMCTSWWLRNTQAYLYLCQNDSLRKVTV
jgi:hypothetical protein